MQYANKVTVFSDNTKQEFVLDFFQNSPEFDDDTNTVVVSAPERVATIVMNSKGVVQLTQMLNEITSSIDTEKPI